MLPLNEPFNTLRSFKRNDMLLPLYASVRAEVRRAMDDWVPAEHWQPYKACVERLGLVVQAESLFERLPSDRIAGRDRSPTTAARGEPMTEPPPPGARVHVVVSARKAWAEEAAAAAWYPVGIPVDRLLLRPRVDARRLGAAFGYPSCCVEAFLKWNSWKTVSHLSQTFKASARADWRANCLTRHTAFMTTFHAPCCFDCAETIRMGAGVLDAVGELDPAYRDHIARELRGTFLVVNEAAVFRLRGARRLADRAVSFEAVEPLCPDLAANAQVRQIRRVLSGAMRVELSDGLLIAENGTCRAYEPSPTSEWVDDPYLVTFE